MTLLKRGITGFGSWGGISEKEVRTFLKRFSFPFSADFQNAIPPTPSSNFWRIPFVNKQDKSEFDLLINTTHWNLGLVTKESTWMNHVYLEFPYEFYLQLRISPSDALPMNPQILNRLFEKEELNELDPDELDQVKYWKSKTIGEVIFNGYD